jgi:hypothetical protein
VPTLSSILFGIWLWGFRLLALLLVAMGALCASVAAIIVALRLGKPGFMPSLSIPFTMLYMIVAAVLGYIGVRGFKATLGGNVNRILANLVE